MYEKFCSQIYEESTNFILKFHHEKKKNTKENAHQSVTTVSKE
jgi:hypothetical protein